MESQDQVAKFSEFIPCYYNFFNIHLATFKEIIASNAQIPLVSPTYLKKEDPTLRAKYRLRHRSTHGRREPCLDTWSFEVFHGASLLCNTVL